MTTSPAFRALATLMMTVGLFAGAAIVAPPDADAAETICTWYGDDPIIRHCVTVGDLYVEGNQICFKVSWDTAVDPLPDYEWDENGMLVMGFTTGGHTLDSGSRTDCL